MQSGEISDTSHVNRVLEVLHWCSVEIPDSRIVLSLGEFPDEIYDRFREAGASRYLLRMESSQMGLYRKWHPEDHSYKARLKALEYLRDSGWQTGTGVLIGMPGQTADDLARDLLFMKNENIDMIGMGPYLENANTSMGSLEDPPPRALRKQLTLRMIALARLMMPTVNIASTTALQTIDGHGLELGLQAGANVVMPNLTPLRYRENYNLYAGKIQVGDGIEEIMGYLEKLCRSIGRTLNLEDPGDPLHYRERMNSAGS
jgi:biotin synthase